MVAEGKEGGGIRVVGPDRQIMDYGLSSFREWINRRIMDYRRGAARKKWDYGLSPENCLRVLGLRINVISRSGLIIGLWIFAAKRLGLMAD